MTSKTTERSLLVGRRDVALYQQNYENLLDSLRRGLPSVHENGEAANHHRVGVTDERILRDLVMEGLQQLPVTMRCVLVLHFTGLKPNEIAEKLVMTEAAVRSHTARARKHLFHYVSQKRDLVERDARIASSAPQAHVERSADRDRQAIGGDGTRSSVLQLEIRSGAASSSEIDDLLGCLDEVYIALGGPGLQFDRESEQRR